MTDDTLRAALDDANRIIELMRHHLAEDHPDCPYAALGVMNDASRAALAASAPDEGPRLPPPDPDLMGTEYGPLTQRAQDHHLGINCWCRPYRDTVDPDVIIHRRAGRA